jgi:DNA-binding NarL/FixJ family response regulator
MLFDRSLEEDCEAELMSVIGRVGAFADELAEVAKRHSKPGSVRSISDLGFTPRQIEISRLVVRGDSSKDIAFQLGIVESTVKYHLSAIFQKLGVASRIEFVHKLSEQRLRIG